MKPSHQWQRHASHPAWLTEALKGKSPWTGSYSVVYPLAGNEVVKLVSEQGAVDFLDLCRRSEGLAALPVVHEVLARPVVRLDTGDSYQVIRLERLRPAGADAVRYAWAYRDAVEAGLSSEECNVERSVQALGEMVRRLEASHRLQGTRDVAAALTWLAQALRPRGWVADLANPDNWMRRTDGTVVLSDPVHLVDNFADDLI